MSTAPDREVPVASSVDFRSLPDNKGLVFIGVAGRRSNPKETLQLALEDAAKRVAVFYRVSGEFAIENNVGSGAFDYTHNQYTSLDYDLEGSKQYVEALQYDADKDIFETENALFVRTTYPGSLSVPVTFRPTYGRKPDWVDNPPREIAGYEVGVGVSGRYSSMADTFNNSYHNAIFAIIRIINNTSRSSNLLYQSSGSIFGYKTSSDNITYSYGTLTGFYVLDMWIDPQTKSVWTLAIAKKPE